MGDVLTFTKFKLGEIITLEVKEQLMKCEVLAHEGKNKYKLRILEGKYRGKYCYFVLEGFEDEQD